MSSFFGTKVNCYVDDATSTLRITDTSVAPSVGTYYFSDYVDLGSSLKVRVTINFDVTRYNSSPLLFDGLTGLFDSLTGLFDDLTGGSSFNDTNVVTYISITNDDPAGTPVWSDYQIFQASDFYGRAFRFKVELRSESLDTTPSISSLSAKIQYN
jgi:hypothetical protein